MLKTYRRNLIFSLMMHIVIFVLIGIFLDFAKQDLKLGNTENQIVATFLYDDNAKQLSLTKAKNEATSDVLKQNKSLLTKKESKDQSVVSKQPASVRHNLASQGNQAESLIALLHAAIQAEQRYPANAEQMQRQGSVTVEFTLSKDGRVSELGIVKSSGTISLDEAALDAVRAAAPFKQVHLQEVQHYNINVIFQLS
ncbi:MAG: TonB family protein [Gammaproteobacteria bacterium]